MPWQRGILRWALPSTSRARAAYHSTGIAHTDTQIPQRRPCPTLVRLALREAVQTEHPTHTMHHRICARGAHDLRADSPTRGPPRRTKHIVSIIRQVK